MHLGSAGYLISAVVVAAAVYVVFYYNRLVRARNMLQEGWSGIDVQLRRHADLVPNLNRDGQRLRRTRARHLRGSGRQAGAKPRRQ